MQRLTARLLLLFALVGIFVPLAQVATAAPPHACCIRAAHKCHSLAPVESDQRTVRGTGCCNHDCCRAETTVQWAHPQPWLASGFVQNIDTRVTESHPTIPAAELSACQSTRAPPQISIA